MTEAPDAILSGMSSIVDQVFGAGGFLARRFGAYEPRPEQVRYAEAVFAAFEAGARSEPGTVGEGSRLLAEGPCGVGKAFGFLAPAIWHVTEGASALLARRRIENGDGYDVADDRSEEDRTPRVLVATETIALQEQLAGKDLPALAEILPWPFDHAIAKGRNNYVCRDRLEDKLVELRAGKRAAPHPRWEEFRRWAEATRTGDLSELDFEVGSMRADVTISSDDCTRKACPEYRACFAEAARARVRKANVVVANYHVLFAHLAFASEFGRGILPRFDLLVLDEGHGAADVAREFFGFAVKETTVAHATRFLGPMPPNHRGGPEGWDVDVTLRGEILARTEDVFRELRRIARSPEYKARLTRRHPGEDWPILLRRLKEAADACEKTAELGASSGMLSKRQEELRRAARRCRVLRDYFSVGLDPTAEGSENFAVFLEEDREKLALRAKPIDVAKSLRERIFENGEIASVVVTSATLATSAGEKGFDFAVAELGAPNADELLVPSPFDFSKQALLVVPRDVPDPKSDREKFAKAFCEKAAEVVEAARGRTLVLCTSTAAAKAAGAEIRLRTEGRYRVLIQGEAPRTKLVEEFRRDVSSVLVGTRSLWTGVDVSGEALSCVVVDKLPFDPQTDPIVDALSERSRDTFAKYSLPRAAIALRQGFGRLIRSKLDRGVVVVFDRRLLEAGYGKKILKGLPPARVSRDLADVAKFFAARAEVDVGA